MNGGEAPATAPHRGWLLMLGCALLLAGNAGLVALRVLHDQFDADELQHTHIAWLIAGGKLIYRDFWDHHGPVFGLLNGFLLSATGADPGTGLMLWLRAASAAASGVLLLLTWLLARACALPARTALLAATLLATLFYFQDAGTEIRPDPLQNVFWVAGLWLAAINLSRRSRSLPLGAGLLFSLAVATNVKALFGPVLLFLYYVGGRRWHRLEAQQVLADLGLMAVGALLPLAALFSWFASQGAVFAWLDMNVTWNLHALGTKQNAWLGERQLLFVLTRQAPFLLALLAGVTAWLVSLRRQPSPGAAMLLVVGLPLAALWPVNDFYSQWLLASLPLLAIVAAAGIETLTTLINRRNGRPMLAIAILASGAFYLFGMAAARTPVTDHPNLVQQRQLTARMLQETPRSEPLGVLWGACGGYMFNAPATYYWAADGDIGDAARRHGGENPFGPALVSAWQAEQVRFVIGRRDAVFNGLPDITRDYLDTAFDYEECLWTRRPAEAAPIVPAPPGDARVTQNFSQLRNRDQMDGGR
jgi:hypothetical protein